MAIHKRTRSEIRHEVARLAEGDGFILGTVTGGDATQAPGGGYFSCNSVGWQHDADYFNDWKEVFCYEGNSGSIGESANPTDWDESIWQLTFIPSHTWVASDSVEMHQIFTVDEYNKAINRAIDSVAKEALELKVDESITLASATYEYDLSTEFMYIHRVEMESSTSDTFDVVTPWSYWRILPETAPRIQFDIDNWAPTVDRKLRITGMASPARLTSDTQQCSINPTFLAYKAAADLMLSRSKEKGDEFFIKGQALAAQAAMERQQIFFDLPMGSKAVLAG